ncbi:hypothetical protein [Antarcticirhabdus aurantiaca]|uniref:Uncharacterized protein n=1 Tax=Antarcticirhabdus aurantiaca TaxID=2606717 RepID=A0ACD4NLT3_9HYPH|nr:hypothetical protein [Antarcticirhabdus aurantiaca]WAJ27855.1 hypothetical protein OXU80_23920 [Jeongeuplla avenae]
MVALRELHHAKGHDPRDQLRTGQLANYDSRQLIARHRRGLERAGFNKAQMFLIGGLDGEWDAGRESYQLHHHLIAWNVPDDVLKKVIAQWPRDADRVRVRKRAQPITDLPRVIAYLDKAWWPRMHRGSADDGRLFTRKCRLPPEIECEFLTWMHANQSRDLRLWLGVKSYKGTIRRT